MSEMYKLKSYVGDLNAEPAADIVYHLPSYHESTSLHEKSTADSTDSVSNSATLEAKERELIDALEKFNLKLNQLLERKPQQTSEKKTMVKQEKTNVKEKKNEHKLPKESEKSIQEKTKNEATLAIETKPTVETNDEPTKKQTDWKSIVKSYEAKELSYDQLVRELCRHLAAQDFLESKTTPSDLDREFASKLIQPNGYLPNNVELWYRRLNGENC
ncbi:hypothetical protein M3Y98_00723900 [Aphelenchoides besseyi]|nr:hypothetical protein M3Y98_00723900 [Aphelenchoides besseyi]KAI6210210.1 hypothetical protein M3Y96_00303500 [Aphelenchoides besseyi]